MCMLIAPPGREQKSKPLFSEAEHVAGLVSPNEPTEDQGMCDRGRLHAMEDDEKMDEDKEETGNEEIGAEEQEVEHQKACAINSPHFPSSREVEDHNMTLTFHAEAGVTIA